MSACAKPKACCQCGVYREISNAYIDAKDQQEFINKIQNLASFDLEDHG